MFKEFLDCGFKHMCKAQANEALKPMAAITPALLADSGDNPLLTLRLMCMDEKGNNYDAKDLAQAVGVPESWFDDEVLAAPTKEVIEALGKTVLVYMSSLRNAAMSECFELEPVENPINEIEFFRHRLAASTTRAKRKHLVAQFMELQQ
jgi:hypothetical protein